MIDIGLYVVLGFLLASLLALMVAPAFWKRAVRLTKRRIEATLPMSAADIQADKDQLRAEFAIQLRQVEVALEKAKDKAARELVEANKRRVEISEIQTELEGTKGRLQEKDNANRVLEQTIRRRLPELEGRLKAAKEAMAELEAANAELRNTAGAQAEALKLARSTLNSQRGDIDQLRGALEGEAVSTRRSAKSDATLARRIDGSAPSCPSSSRSSPTDKSAATKTVCCAMSSASSQAKCSLWPRHKALRSLTSRLFPRPRLSCPAHASLISGRRRRSSAGMVEMRAKSARPKSRSAPPRASASLWSPFPETLIPEEKMPEASPRRRERLPSFSPPARRSAAEAEPAGPEP